MNGELIALKFKTKDGHVTTFNVSEIIEIDGVPFNRFTSIESVKVETDPLIERAVLDLQERVKNLEAQLQANLFATMSAATAAIHREQKEGE